MMNTADAQAIYDAGSYRELAARASRNPQAPEVQQEVARKFESVLIDLMLQRMRATVPEDEVFGSDQMKFVQSLADEQFAKDLADPGLGLADMLLAQMRSGHMPATGGQSPGSAELARGTVAWSAPAAAGSAGAPDRRPLVAADARAFVERLMPAAQAVAAQTGVPVKLIIGQAALESDWGRQELRRADGRPSFNLFGVKASGSWNGATVTAWTSEYDASGPHRVQQDFRAYGSYEEALADYARLISSSPRYRAALGQGLSEGEIAERIQQAGYATDPSYARKLSRIMHMVQVG